MTAKLAKRVSKIYEKLAKLHEDLSLLKNDSEWSPCSIGLQRVSQSLDSFIYNYPIQIKITFKKELRKFLIDMLEKDIIKLKLELAEINCT